MTSDSKISITHVGFQGRRGKASSLILLKFFITVQSSVNNQY